jgi:nucleoid-associated protein YgaU
MRTVLTVLVVLAALLAGQVAVAQEEMTKEQWQQEMNKLTSSQESLKAQLKALQDEIAAREGELSKLNGDYDKAMTDMYAMVGATPEQAAAYRSEIEALKSKADELSRLSDADLVARSGEVEELAAKTNAMWENKLSLVPEFWDGLTAVNDQVKSMQTVLANQVKTYTVGTWSRDRDCLWNIAKKPTIYDNAWLWPKIWQGNRDQIKDPDVIEPGQKLRIPQGNVLTDEEKSAARKYYSKRTVAPPVE